MNSIIPWENTRSSKSKLVIHLVFVTKYRRLVFDSDMLTQCEVIMREVCTEEKTVPHEFNGEQDHVHLNDANITGYACVVIGQKVKRKNEQNTSDNTLAQN